MNRMPPEPDPKRLAVIAIGSNLGDPVQQVHLAMERLKKLSDGLMLRSSLWRSTPVDCPPGSPDFINAVVAITPSLSDAPDSLLARLQAMEARLGRKPKQMHNEARAIDLDLISFGDQTRNAAHLKLPHPRAHERAFVLAPLAEMLPNFVAPGWSRSAADLLAQLSPENRAIERLV